ncbi:Xaa-Pro dipeptidase [Candidatus Hepatincola sp. Av]
MKKLHELQTLLHKLNIDAFIFSTTDEYMSEYVPEAAKRLEYLTEFTGSLALCIVGKKTSAIFVDGRYTLQAKQQVDNTLFTIKSFTIADIEDWLAVNLATNNKIILPEKVTSINFYNQINEICIKYKFQIGTIDYHLVDEIWQDKPIILYNKIVKHNFASKSYVEKLDSIAKDLQKEQLDWFLCTDLSSIAWLLNLRGNDIEYNPFFLSVALINRKGICKVFLDSTKLSQEIQNEMKDKVEFLPLSSIDSYINKLFSVNTPLLVGLPISTPYYYLNFLKGKQVKVVIVSNICEKKKAIKDSSDIKHILNAHARDGAYLVKLFAKIYEDPNKYSELNIDEAMEVIKKEDPLYCGCSFASIIGVSEHGAIVHYKATSKTNKDLSDDDYLLIDCGAQYQDGTTDITRTLSFKKVSRDFKKHYTLVLKGHISLANAIFPKNTKASYIDVLARHNLWQEGLDYAHGTGHGVGMFLGVHDGGVSLSANSNMLLKQGMVLSIEPGVYFTGKYGIRLENLYTIVQSNHKDFLCFQVLSMLPFDVKNIDFSLLTTAETNWLNNYHRLVLSSLQPYLDSKHYTWLNNYLKGVV